MAFNRLKSRLFGKMAERSAKRLNAAVDSSNMQKVGKDPFEAQYARVEIAPTLRPDRMFKHGQKYDPNMAGQSAGYATRIAEQQFGLKYKHGHAWELGEKNSRLPVMTTQNNLGMQEIEKQEIQRLINSGMITPGMIIGIKIPPSAEISGTIIAPEHETKKGRPNHAIIYIGLKKGEPVFWHNFFGPRTITLNQLIALKDSKRERLFYPTEIIKTKES